MAKTVFNLMINGKNQQFTDPTEALAAMTAENERLAALAAGGGSDKSPFRVSIDYRGQANVYLGGEGNRFPIMVLDREKFNALRANIGGIIATVASVEGKLSANWESLPKALPKGSPNKPAAITVPAVVPAE